jgi:hypothetical protein
VAARRANAAANVIALINTAIVSECAAASHSGWAFKLRVIFNGNWQVSCVTKARVASALQIIKNFRGCLSIQSSRKEEVGKQYG